MMKKSESTSPKKMKRISKIVPQVQPLPLNNLSLSLNNTTTVVTTPTEKLKKIKTPESRNKKKMT